MLIAWSNEKNFPDLAGDTAGIGEPIAAYTTDGKKQVYVSGLVVFDDQQLSVTATPDRGIVRAIVLHELGHLVGLGHTADRNEIMYSESNFDVRDYGVGDLQGLAMLGTQPCAPNV